VATIPAHENEFPSLLFAEGAAPSTPATGLVKAYAKSDGLLYWKDDAGTEYAVASGVPDAVDVTFDPTGLVNVTGTEVQTAIEELDAAVSGGGISPTIVDAKGDIIAATAADTVARLAAGTNGTALVAASGETTGLKWGIPNAHYVIAYHNTTQTVNGAVIPLNSEVADTDGYHSTSSNTSRLVVPAGLGGLYMFEFGSNIASLAAGEFLRVQKTVSGPTATNVSTNIGGTAAVGSGYVIGSGIVFLAATDFIELVFTGNRTLGHASAFEAQTHLSMALIGA
jgi:hypothetical protein